MVLVFGDDLNQVSSLVQRARWLPEHLYLHNRQRGEGKGGGIHLLERALTSPKDLWTA